MTNPESSGTRIYYLRLNEPIRNDGGFCLQCFRCGFNVLFFYIYKEPFSLFSLFFFFDGVSLCPPGWSAVMQSQLTAASALQFQVILLPQLPE